LQNSYYLKFGIVQILVKHHSHIIALSVVTFQVLELHCMIASFLLDFSLLCVSSFTAYIWWVFVELYIQECTFSMS